MRFKLLFSKQSIFIAVLLFCITFYLSAKVRLYFDMQRFSTTVRDGAALTDYDHHQYTSYLNQHNKGHMLNALTWFPAQAKASIPTIELKISENALSQWRMVKHKPEQVWENASIKTWAGDFYPVKVRMRGDYSYHWGVDTPSLKVKMEHGQSMLGYRKFNLINARSATGFERVLGAQLAQSMGLLSEQTGFVRVFVNGQSWGPFQFVSPLEETWLRKNNELPGDVYSGEVEPQSKPKGEIVTEHNEDIWYKQKYWEKTSHNNAILESDYSRWNAASLALQNSFAQPNVQHRKSFEDHFDVESLLKLMALENYIGSRHTDQLHNWKLLHDPASGKLKTIAWDLWGYGHGAKVNDVDLFWPLALPQLNVLRYPDLYLKKNQYLYALMQEDEKNKITEKTLKFLKTQVLPLYREAKHVHRPIWVKFDPWTEMGTAFEQPRFVVHDFYKRIVEFYDQRIGYLKQALKYPKVKLLGYQDANKKNHLKISVYGESAIEVLGFDGVPIREKPLIGTVFYPGVKIKPYTIWHSAYKAELQEQEYDLVLEARTLPTNLELKNLVTGETFMQTVQKNVSTTNQNKNQVSLYNVGALPVNHAKTYIGPGKVNFTSDQIFSPGQTLEIHPGTDIVLSAGVSIIVQGDLIAKGTLEKPITIFGQEGQAFGVLAVQSASRADLSHVYAQGGSVGKYNGVVYTGMISFYHVEQVKMHHVHVKKNSIGDDMVNLKHVQDLEIKNSVFADALADALDLDYVKGSITDSEFKNSGNDGVDMMGSHIKISFCKFKLNQDKAISVGESSLAYIDQNDFEGVKLALAVKDLSIVREKQSKLKEVDVFASVYQKSSYYHMGGVLLSEDKDVKKIITDKTSYILRTVDQLSPPENIEMKVPLEQQIQRFQSIWKD